jgi:hypothetical protein
VHWQVGGGGANIRGSLGLIYLGFMHIYIYIYIYICKINLYILLLGFCKENKIEKKRHARIAQH